MRKVVFFLMAAVVVAAAFFVWLYPQYEVPILMYHSFNEALVGKYAAVSPKVFARQMEFLHDRGYHVISLEEYCWMRISDKRIPRNSVVLTIDDGYEDTVRAFEILDRYDFPVTAFVITEKIGTAGYLTREDIQRYLSNRTGTLGSHTMTEAYLPEISEPALEKEVITSKKVLEKRFEVPVNTFSYTRGGYDRRVLAKVEEAGYLCACTTNRGYTKDQPRYELRRIKVTDRDTGIRFWGKLTGYYNVFRELKEPH
ncbi:MAG: polysaccharide deacetylase family protein [Candidatus Omnitrophica bacterium]|nr:polysaccharide deacetylase family protein [Candidatus Omnitrophota bacterium]